jgi:hypothetical protein
MQITPKIEIGLKLFCILILIILNIAIYLNGKELSCDNCTIKFTSKQIGAAKDSVFEVSISEMVSSYAQNKCLVDYDFQEGS